MITLATLPQATAQEVFDQVKNHLLTQNKQSRSGDGCAYRGQDYTKCAAGCLISDDEFNFKFKGKLNSYSWYDLVNESVVPEHHASLIYELQLVHDTNKPEHWEAELKEIALLNKLNY